MACTGRSRPERLTSLRLPPCALTPPLHAGWTDGTPWSAEVEALVLRLTSEARGDGTSGGTKSSEDGAGRPLVVFDFDNTTIFGDIFLTGLVLQSSRMQYGFDLFGENAPLPKQLTAQLARRARAGGNGAGERLFRQSTHALLAHYERMWGGSEKVAACEFLAHLLTGLQVEEARQLARDTMAWMATEPLCWRPVESAGLGGETVPLQWGIRPRTAVRDMMERLRGGGFDVWVVSASPQYIVEGAVEWFGVPHDHVLGVRNRVREGRLTAEVVPPVTYGPGKVDAIRKYIGRRPVLVFGDSRTDWEMLTWAEHGVLIHTSGEVELAADARKAGLLLQPPFGAIHTTPTCPGPLAPIPPNEPRAVPTAKKG